jgi:hypothetical protein
LLALIIAVVIFLVLREIFCWYWKINRMVELLESIDANLRGRAAGAPGAGRDWSRP